MVKVGDNNGCVHNDAQADNSVMVYIRDPLVVPVVKLEVTNDELLMQEEFTKVVTDGDEFELWESDDDAAEGNRKKEGIIKAPFSYIIMAKHFLDSRYCCGDSF